MRLHHYPSPSRHLHSTTTTTTCSSSFIQQQQQFTILSPVPKVNSITKPKPKSTLKSQIKYKPNPLKISERNSNQNQLSKNDEEDASSKEVEKGRKFEKVEEGSESGGGDEDKEDAVGGVVKAVVGYEFNRRHRTHRCYCNFPLLFLSPSSTPTTTALPHHPFFTLSLQNLILILFSPFLSALNYKTLFLPPSSYQQQPLPIFSLLHLLPDMATIPRTPSTLQPPSSLLKSQSHLLRSLQIQIPYPHPHPHSLPLPFLSFSYPLYPSPYLTGDFMELNNP